MTSRNALIVGINQYPKLNSLRLPATDAEAIAQLLEQQGEFRISRWPEVVENGEVIIGKDVTSIADLPSPSEITIVL